MKQRFSAHKFFVVRMMLAFFLGLAVQASAAGLLDAGKREFLPVEEAFQTTASQAEHKLTLQFEIAPEHYLYAKQFRLSWPQGLQSLPTLPAFKAAESTASWHDDPSFGRVEIFRDRLSWTFNLPALSTAQLQQLQQAGGFLTVRYQGCADAGLCYPPQHWQVPISALATPTNALSAPPELNADDANSIATWLAQANFWGVLAAFFILGLGLAMTPCVLPMLPILSAIIAGQQGSTATTFRGFALALSYVLGMALMYSLLGLLIAHFGAAANLSTWMQQPAVLIPFAGLFLLLAYLLWRDQSLALPNFIQRPLQRWQAKQQGGAYGSVFLMGAISSLVVSPCVSAPLAGVLLFISTSQDTVLGASALFSLGLGLGVPLLMLGLGGGRWLPRSGPWLEASKKFFALMLVAVAIMLVNRVLPSMAQLLLWAGFFTLIGSSVVSRVGLLSKLIGVAFLLWAMLLVFSAARGGDSAWTPWTVLTSTSSSTQMLPASQIGFIKLTDPLEVDKAIAQAALEQKPVIVDIYADWCVSCIEMEKKVLVLPDIVALLAPGVRIKFDITDTTGAQLAWLQREKIIGPPAFLFWNARAQKQPSLIGESTKSTFESSVINAWN